MNAPVTTPSRIVTVCFTDVRGCQGEALGVNRFALSLLRYLSEKFTFVLLCTT